MCVKSLLILFYSIFSSSILLNLDISTAQMLLQPALQKRFIMTMRVSLSLKTYSKWMRNQTTMTTR